MRPLVLAVAPFVALCLGACGGGGSSPVQPRYQPEIVNAPDSFSFQLTDVVNGSGSLSYTWQNGGPAASVDRSSSVSDGTVRLTLRDAAGAQVYEGSLAGATGSAPTASGVAGAWTIVVDFVRASGTINFRAQRL